MAPKKRILFDDEADDSYSDEEEAEDDDEDDSSLAEFVVNDSDEESAETFQDSNESDDDYNIARPFRAAVAAGTQRLHRCGITQPDDAADDGGHVRHVGCGGRVVGSRCRCVAAQRARSQRGGFCPTCRSPARCGPNCRGIEKVTVGRQMVSSALGRYHLT